MTIKMGLIINPIAGMGGRVALKGTDGPEILAAALARGAVAEAGSKTERALKKLLPLREKLLILTGSGQMGEHLCRQLGLSCEIIHTCRAESTAEDTVAAAGLIAASDAVLLLFSGGDGTAGNVCEAVGTDFPVIGIPAGVKIQSAVFAIDPEAAGALAALLLGEMAVETAGSDAAIRPIGCTKREVVDLDENAYRTGHVSATLYGVMSVPDHLDYLQNMKQGGFSKEEAQLTGIADYVIEHMEPDCFYAIGSGSTAKCISRRLGLSYELLGIDIIKNKQLAASDVTEEQLWNYAGQAPLYLVVSPIGGQGFLFGRGNHQFSARVINAAGRQRILVVSPISKLLSIPRHCLRADCGDTQVNAVLHGFYNVICGYNYFVSFLCKPAG